jgi:hypothetical protein
LKQKLNIIKLSQLETILNYALQFRLTKDYEIEYLINSAGAELIFTPSLLSRESHLWNLAGQNLKISSVLISLELQNNWIELLVSASAQITEDDAMGWFEHCGLFI